MITRHQPSGAGLVGFRDTDKTTRVMVLAIMVSMVVFLDSTVVNLALPSTRRQLAASATSSNRV